MSYCVFDLDVNLFMDFENTISKKRRKSKFEKRKKKKTKTKFQKTKLNKKKTNIKKIKEKKNNIKYAQQPITKEKKNNFNERFKGNTIISPKNIIIQQQQKSN